MDADRIAQIRARLGAATPGEWHLETIGQADFIGEWLTYDKTFLYFGPDHRVEWRGPPADADLICHAPADIRFLLAALDATQAELAARTSELAQTLTGLSDLAAQLMRTLRERDAARAALESGR